MKESLNQKKIVIGLFVTATLAFFTGCASLGGKGSAPVIKTAFIATNYVDNNLEATKKYKTNTLSFSAKPQLIIQAEDIDGDMEDLLFSITSEFSGGIRWNISDAPASFWVPFPLEVSKEYQADFLQTNKPVYVRIYDSKGNGSNVFVIEGITIKK